MADENQNTTSADAGTTTEKKKAKRTPWAERRAKDLRGFKAKIIDTQIKMLQPITEEGLKQHGVDKTSLLSDLNSIAATLDDAAEAYDKLPNNFPPRMQRLNNVPEIAFETGMKVTVRKRYRQKYAEAFNAEAQLTIAEMEEGRRDWIPCVTETGATFILKHTELQPVVDEKVVEAIDAATDAA